MAGSTRQAQTDVTSFARNMEAVSYKTYREWPIFLVRREQQLKQILIESGAVLPDLSTSFDLTAREGTTDETKTGHR